MDNKLIDNNYNIDSLFDNIKDMVINSRNRVYSAVNTEMLNLYWNIGKVIMEIQQGDERAAYGDAVLDKLSQKLTNEFGKGFSSRNLRTMRKFYIMYPIWKTVSAKLSWSHYLELIKIDEEPKRNFYLNECINSRWSVRELERQIGSLLYERLALSANKQKVLELAEKGHELKTSKDLVKDPFVLEFLDIKENTEYLESDLEKNILEHLKEFLLELGKGFMFVGSQVRLTLEEDHFYPDLVFYNRLLKCFVIIDLKIGKVTHQDIGQMQMYVNYYDREIKKDDENPTVGILLSTLKNKTVVKYTLPEDNKNIFSSQYKLHLPTEKELIDAIEEEKTNLRLNNDDNKI
jgi:predicted nuclease of restriction endonuclease-like (RecB) superfamily